MRTPRESRSGTAGSCTGTDASRRSESTAGHPSDSRRISHGCGPLWRSYVSNHHGDSRTFVKARGRSSKPTASSRASRGLPSLRAGGPLQTPPIYEGALPGITRSAVLEIAARAKIRAREMFVSLDRLRGADEVFLSGSGVGVLSITSVDGRRMEAPGPATRTIQDGYATMLDAEAKW